MTIDEFLRNWRSHSLNENQAAQSFINDLCELVDHEKPTKYDNQGDIFAFEKPVRKPNGKAGRADCWYKDHFAIEVKGRGKDLAGAYLQLLEYRGDLANPPLLIVTDTWHIHIYTNFTSTLTEVHKFTIEDLRKPEYKKILNDIFKDPWALHPSAAGGQLTEAAARKFGELADQMRRWNTSSEEIAHYLIRILFILFAEDTNLLPRGIFSKLVEGGQRFPHEFNQKVALLFAAMADGGIFDFQQIKYFNGGLFNDAPALTIHHEELKILKEVAALNWSKIRPSILGTLFTRSLDPAKRAQLGAHYTGEEDIIRIVEPVLMQPLRREWETIKAQARQIATEREEGTTLRQKARKQTELEQLVSSFSMRLQSTHILDPACGSGNFLYIALRLLLDLEREVNYFCGEVNVQPFFPQVSPVQLYGIEINEYAHELAQATVWIGYLQWLNDNGYGVPGEPILKDLRNIELKDAILAYDENGNPAEPEWPEADVIVGNPPFLGGNKIRQELGNDYVESLFTLYNKRVPAFADLVTYWFERGRNELTKGRAKRIGLLATNSISQGVNRQVLKRIKETGEIFWAQSDRPWILEGAAVRVSMVAFDDGSEAEIRLDDIRVPEINSNLTSSVDFTRAAILTENKNIAFIGDTKKGKFDIPNDVAQEMLATPNSLPTMVNSDVVVPWINGLDLTSRPRKMWIIDFGNAMALDQAMLYTIPFYYVEQHVLPERKKTRNERERRLWWIHGRTGPDMRHALSTHVRYIATARVSKHRMFSFVDAGTLPDGQVVVFARSDDYFLGVLHSRPHEIWALKMGTTLEDRPRYSQTMTFETYPFPWLPGTEPTEDPRVMKISAAAAELVRQRDAWLNPPDLPESELKKRTLTNLYNALTEEKSFDKAPDQDLILAIKATHKRLDRAVYAAYGWEYRLEDDEILSRLLALNLQRAAASKPRAES